MTETAPENRTIECPECGGFGSIGDGPFTMGMNCPPCGGRGVRDISTVTEKVVRKILDQTSDQTGKEYDEHLVKMLVITLDGPDSIVLVGGDDGEGEYTTPSSLAALNVRGRLWGTYPSDVASLAACNLFYALGRQPELGCIEEDVPDYRFEG